MLDTGSTLRWKRHSLAHAAELPKGLKTVLVAEDHEVLRTTICRVLQESGCTALQAANADEALLVCERHVGPIHLLLTDVVLPGMNGAELFGRLASLYPEMRVLYMSGWLDGVIGASFLKKPFTRNLLLRKVREALGTPVLEPDGRLDDRNVLIRPEARTTLDESKDGKRAK